MLSSVLNSERAVRVNIEIMRAFVKWRRAFAPLINRAGGLHWRDGVKR